jgi:hypothetical protein
MHSMGGGDVSLSLLKEKVLYTLTPIRTEVQLYHSGFSQMYHTDLTTDQKEAVSTKPFGYLLLK